MSDVVEGPLTKNASKRVARLARAKTRKSFKKVQLQFEGPSTAEIVEPKHHEGCCVGKMCFHSKGRMATAATQKVKCPKPDCPMRTWKNIPFMEQSVVAKRFTADYYTGGDGPDLILHDCRVTRGGCGGRFGSWEYISDCEAVIAVLVEKKPWGRKEPQDWAAWMVDAQQSITNTGELLEKFRDMNYMLQKAGDFAFRILFYKWIPRVRARNRLVDFFSVLRHGVKRQWEDEEASGHKKLVASPGTLAKRAHFRFAARKLHYLPLGSDNSVLVPQLSSTIDDSALVVETDEVAAPPGDTEVSPSAQERPAKYIALSNMEVDAGANTLSELSLPPPVPVLDLPLPVPSIASRHRQAKKPSSGADDEDIENLAVAGPSGVTGPLTSTQKAAQINNMLRKAVASMPAFLSQIQDQNEVTVIIINTPL